MGLRDTIQSGVDAAFSALGDIKEGVTYTQYTGVGTYDPDTGTRTPTTVDHTIDVVLTAIKESEVDWSPVTGNTQKCIINASSISFTPGEHDTITIDGEIWNVKRKLDVPGGSIHVLALELP